MHNFPPNCLRVAKCVQGDLCDRDFVARETEGKEVITVPSRFQPISSNGQMVAKNGYLARILL
jgi:hypothetical protein